LRAHDPDLPAALSSLKAACVEARVEVLYGEVFDGEIVTYNFWARARRQRAEKQR